MTHPLLKLCSRILEVPVRGVIDQSMTQKISRSLQRTRIYPISALTVTINSQGGSLTQANNLVDIFRNYSSKKNIPVYCFAQQQCLGAANVILVSGARVFASEMSIIGDFGFNWAQTDLVKMSEKYDIKREYILGGQNKQRTHPLQEMNSSTIQFTKNHLKNLEQELIRIITLRRNQPFKNLGYGSEELKQKLFNRMLISGQEAKRLGLIDQIATRQQFKSNKYRGHKTESIFRHFLIDEANMQSHTKISKILQSIKKSQLI